jgi:hypothetical protein
MLGTQAQYPNQYPTEAKPAKGRNRRKPTIAVVLLALVGISGWWVYQNSTAGQAQAAPGQMANASGPAVTGQLPGLGTNVSENTAASRAPSAGTTASTGSASAGPPAVQANASYDQAADHGLQLASLAGVAEVAGTPIWNDDCTLLGTLDSGSILIVKARTSDDTWLAVETGAGSGWAQASTVIAYGLHNLATAALPEAVALASAQADSAAVVTVAAVESSTAGGNLSLADLVPTSSSADSSQLAPATAVQLTAKIAITGSGYMYAQGLARTTR